VKINPPTSVSTATNCACGFEAIDLDIDVGEHDFTPQRQQTVRWKPPNIDDTHSFMQAGWIKATRTHRQKPQGATLDDMALRP
jgi:hypothetical protein